MKRPSTTRRPLPSTTRRPLPSTTRGQNRAERDVHMVIDSHEDMTMVNCGPGADSERCPRDYKCVKNAKYGYAVCCKGSKNCLVHELWFS